MASMRRLSKLLHDIFPLERPLIIFDCESTGIEPEKDRIVQLGFQYFTAEGMTKEWHSIINPLVPIPPDSTKSHGITDEDVLHHCAKCRKPPEAHPSEECPEFKPVPTFAAVAPGIARGFVNCDFGGKNTRFDLRLTAAEMRRNKIEWSYRGARILDADRLEQIGEPRSLSHLYKKHTGKELKNAHDAMVDVRGTTELIAAQIRTYTILSRNLDELHHAQWPGWIDTEGKFRFNQEGKPVVMFGKHRHWLMASVPPDYWAWILKPKTDFSAEIKEIASKAQRGDFPKPSTKSSEPSKDSGGQ